MPGARSKERRKPKAAARRSPRAFGWILAGLVLATIACVGLWAWLRSPVGRASMLRLGDDTAYREVQQAVDRELAALLPGYVAGDISGTGGQDNDGDSHEWPLPVAGPGAAVHCRLVWLPDGLGFWQAEALIDATVQRVGARILWGERICAPSGGAGPASADAGQEYLRLDLGVPGRPTHTLLLCNTEADRPALRWGAGEASLWALLAKQPSRPTVALVIDDWGYFDNDTTRRILQLKVPLTLGVLPGLSFSRRFALQATELAVPTLSAATARLADTQAGDAPALLRRKRWAAGLVTEFSLGRSWVRLPDSRREVILHLPMEPHGYPQVDPGPGAILVGMSEDRIRELVEAAIARLPAVTGVSNHMGSAATSDRRTMQRVMRVLAREDLFFLDSLTSPESVASEAARREEVVCLRSRIFLDQPTRDRQQIRDNLERLIAAARRTGFAIGIGHPYPETLAVLSARLPALQDDGIRFVTVSELLALKEVAAGRHDDAGPGPDRTAELAP